MRDACRFASPKAFLLCIQDTDYYCEKTGQYVFCYNDKGSIAVYSLSEEKVEELRELSAESGESWSAFLDAGGFIYDDPSHELFEESKTSNLDWCKENYRNLWEDVSPYEERYTPSATHGDYSPSCPWNAPGMSVKDFI